MPGDRLGKGVSALFGGDARPFEHSARLAPLAHLHPNPHQPRRRFPADEIEKLAASISAYGIIQPLIVEERGLDDYIIIAGERRYRAAKRAGLGEVPIICRQSGETERLELALVENIQRSDLNPIEEANAYRAIIEQTRLTQEELAARVGTSRSALTNSIRLLGLPESVQRLLEKGRLTAGHARAILILPDDDARERLATEIVRRSLSVRESEQLAGRLAGRQKGRQTEGTPTEQQSEQQSVPPSARQDSAPAGSATPLPPELAIVEERVRDRLLTKVAVRGNAERGSIVISYHSLNDLNRIYKRICGIADATQQ